eukprot:5928308-Pyramimonas_sp.AAC.1
MNSNARPLEAQALEFMIGAKGTPITNAASTSSSYMRAPRRAPAGNSSPAHPSLGWGRSRGWGGGGG